jgi:hypothetical protein
MPDLSVCDSAKEVLVLKHPTVVGLLRWIEKRLTSSGSIESDQDGFNLLKAPLVLNSDFRSCGMPGVSIDVFNLSSAVIYYAPTSVFNRVDRINSDEINSVCYLAAMQYYPAEFDGTGFVFLKRYTFQLRKSGPKYLYYGSVFYPKADMRELLAGERPINQLRRFAPVYRRYDNWYYSFVSKIYGTLRSRTAEV